MDLIPPDPGQVELSRPSENDDVVDRLRQDNRRLAARVEELEAQMGPSPHAVNLLSQAQLSADRIIEEAEQYARELVDVARLQHREILADARAAATPARPSPVGVLEPGSRIEYLRVYTEIAQTQLRAVVAGLTAEIDKLGQASTPPSGPPAQPIARPLRQPFNGSGPAAN